MVYKSSSHNLGLVFLYQGVFHYVHMNLFIFFLVVTPSPMTSHQPLPQDKIIGAAVGGAVVLVLAGIFVLLMIMLYKMHKSAARNE